MTTVEAGEFGRTEAGEPVERYVLSNSSGVRLACITYGATVTELATPDRHGVPGNIVLGFDALAPYARQSAYLGAVVGRYAGRLANGRFELDGVTHQLSCNEGRRHLHGGLKGFDKHVWAGHVRRTADRVGVMFARRSRAGEEGYPGALDVSVTYWLGDASEVSIEFAAVTSAPTIVNLTQHSYFNLSAGAAATIADHALRIRADAIVEVDADLIPTGRIIPVEGTAFDFRTACAIGARIDDPTPQMRYGAGYDHTWVLSRDGRTALPVASLLEPVSGRRLDVFTTEPGLHIYSGNRLDIVSETGGRRYGARAGVCLETQHFPNAPAQPHFPCTVLRPHQVFRSTTTWRLGRVAH